MDLEKGRLGVHRFGEAMDVWVFWMSKLSELSQDIALAKNLVLNAIDFHFASTVFAEDDFVANSYAQCTAHTAIKQLAWPNGNHLATLWLFFRRVRQNDTTSGGLFGFKWLHNDTVIKRTNVYLCHLECSLLLKID
jgi:hypothetical protein